MIQINYETYSEPLIRSFVQVRVEELANVVSTKIVPRLLQQTPLYEKRIISSSSDLNHGK
jgi:hypothetical protein